jgi:hypothetical protein
MRKDETRKRRRKKDIAKSAARDINRENVDQLVAASSRHR